jgi:hypothetical protein
MKSHCLTFAALSALAAALLPSCGGSTSNSEFGPNGQGGAGDGGTSPGLFGTGDDGGGSPAGCTGIQCQIHTCPTGGANTTISGTIYDPAGKNPLYDVVAYVPNSKPLPLPAGASCDDCNSLFTGNPIATALTGPDGKFVLRNAPDGPNIPLVIQVGKWRKQITIPNVTRCQDNPLPDKSLTLPKNHNEGDIPNIAISTGGADTLECLLSRIGVDKAEYGPGASGPGRIHIFKGADDPNSMAPDTSPSAPASYQSLWNSKNDLLQFDIVLLSCEGQPTTDTTGNGASGTALTASDLQALHDYTSAGGRVFASHYHYAWFTPSGQFSQENLASWVPDSSINTQIDGTIVQTLPNGKPFAKGVALHSWLGNVNALTNDELPIDEARHDANVTAANTPSQSWIQSDPNSGAKCSSGHTCATMYFSFDTPTNAPPGPTGEPAYCGRVVYSDLHVGGASGDYGGGARIVPAGCADKDLSAQEKALEFMLFDLSSCVTPDNSGPPQPPPPIR